MLVPETANNIHVYTYLQRKRVYSKRQEFAPNGNRYFPFRVDPFTKGLSVQKNKYEVTKVTVNVLKFQTFYGTANPLFTDTRYNDKIRFNDSLTVTKALLKR